MTKPRTEVHRELYGIIGKVPDASKLLREWNAFFREQGIDASMDFYPTTGKNLPERMSEMFHFDRRGYIVGKDLSKMIISLLDEVDSSIRDKGIDFVLNTGGVLYGKKSTLHSSSQFCISHFPFIIRACRTPSSKKRN